MSGKFYLIDGSALAYRAYFAFAKNPLRNSKGEETSAPFGFANSLIKLFREERPACWVCVFDTPEPTFRHKIYPEYKSTRAKMPDEMAAQLPRVKEVAVALGCPIVEMPGYEADDVIGTLAAQASAKGLESVLVSGDKDFMQLVTERVTIYNSRRKGGQEEVERLDPQGVEQKFGVPPHLVVDVLGLAGDSSDNVPGVPGIGPKTAVSLVQEFGDLEAVLTNRDKISRKLLREKLTQYAEQARFSRQLVTIKTDVPIQLAEQEYAIASIASDAARKLFLELEFPSLIRQLEAIKPDTAPDPTPDEAIVESEPTPEPTPNTEVVEPEPAPAESAGVYLTVTDLAALRELAAKWGKAKQLAVDTETTSLNPRDAELVGISICAEAGLAYYIPVGHLDSEGNLNREEVLTILKPLLEGDQPALIGQNIKYDWQILHNYGISLGGIQFDPMLASYLLEPNERRHDLGSLARRHFGLTMTPIENLIGTGKKQRSFAEVDISVATRYAAADADLALRLAAKQAPQLKPRGLEFLFAEIEVPLVEVLANMEFAGVAVDIPYLKKLSAAWKRKLTGLTGKIYRVAGEEFNINSPQQLGVILFDKLGLKSVRKTARTAQRATDVSTLAALTGEHPLPAIVLEYRSLTKLKSTYADALVNLVNQHTGRVHTSFNQAVAATGRLSSSDPNLQNIPIRTPDGRKIRRAFIPRDKQYTLLAADYSQIELRLMAHFSGDENLCNAFARGEDIHVRTAADIFGITTDLVDPEQRRWAKSANFGIIYGLSAFGLSQQTAMTVREAKDFIDTYFRRYPRVREFIDSTIGKAREEGGVRTLFGRWRPLPDLNASSRQRREFAERVAVNTPLQGTAADIIKKAMIDIAALLTNKKSVMVLQVHDELVFEAALDELDWLTEMVTDKMEQVTELSVPLKVDLGTGDNWLDAK